MTQFPSNLSEAIDWLSQFGATNEGGVTRTLYSKEWQEAQQSLKVWMEDLGLTTRYDSIGNLFGQLASLDQSAPTVLIGSHIDTVISGGKYDGAYGILASILAITELYTKYGPPKKNLEVVSLCEEEGSRFPLACWGSGMLTGVYSMETIKGVQDLDGIRFEEAMKKAGFGKKPFEPFVKELETFIELHIEQGASLERLGKSIGIVETIVGQMRYRVHVKGESNHAGTTLMKWRRDPLHCAVSMIHEIYDMVKQYDEHLVTTVGQLIVEPNVSNVIPSQVVFTIDARHPDSFILSSFSGLFSKRFLEIAKARGVVIEIELYHEVAPVKMDSKLNENIQMICMKENITYQKMNSGAGHDAQLFAGVSPTTLLFVPSHNGISHSPLEYTSTKDLETGFQVLTQLLHKIAY